MFPALNSTPLAVATDCKTMIIHTPSLRFVTIGVFLGTVLAMGGCKPEPTATIGDPFDNFEGMLGQWELSGFLQLDDQSPLFEERDLTQFYTGDGIVPMTLSLEESGMYSVVIEKGRNYFGAQGTWDLDDKERPTPIAPCPRSLSCIPPWQRRSRPLHLLSWTTAAANLHGFGCG